MSNPYTFNTRELGPNAKGTTLTFGELDNSLLFLSSSISTLEFTPLSGSNYSFIEANGTPLQNGSSLIASYNIAKTTSPTGSNRYAVLLGSGKYQFTQSFTLDTPYIDVVSLTGYKDVYITGSNTIQVSADNVYVRGIDVGSKNFTITSSLPNSILKNCKGGSSSFGGSIVPSAYTISSTFVDCEGGDYSFAGNGNAYGTFINCTAGDYSFGNNCDGTFTDCVGGASSFASQGDIEGGTLENCTAGIDSFAAFGNIISPSILKRCVGNTNSFCTIISTNMHGLLENCQLIGSSFTSPLGANGKIINCYGSSNIPFNHVQ